MTGDAWWQTEWAPAWVAIAVAVVSLLLTGVGVFLSGRAQRRTEKAIERLEGMATAWTRWNASGWTAEFVIDQGERALTLTNRGKDDAEECLVEIWQRLVDVPRRGFAIGPVLAGQSAVIDLHSSGIDADIPMDVTVRSTRPAVGTIVERVFVAPPPDAPHVYFV